MIKIRHKLYSMTLIAALALILSACNSAGSDPSSQSSSGTGSVAVLLTDAPIDDFDQFMLTVTEISLLGDDGAVSLFSGNETIDLLDLKSHSDLFSLASGIPAGSYYKVRMRVSNPQLIRLDMNGNIETTESPEMGGNGKLDLNPRGEIVVTPGVTIALQVDLDIAKSIHLIQNGKGEYRFRPVVFIDVLTEKISGKLVRVSGYVDDIESDRFELCQHLDSISDYEHDEDQDRDERCIEVFTANTTSYFDELGDVVPMPSLQENDVITVLGYYRDLSGRYLGLDAEVVEMAAADHFQSYLGTIDSINTDNATFVLRDQNDVLTEVLFYPESKAYSMSGEAMELDELTLGMNIKVEGVYDLLAEQLKAAVIFVEPASSLVTQLVGSLLTLHDDLTGFNLTGNPSDVCVTVDENTVIYLLTIENDSFSSEQVGFSDLLPGQHLEAYGAFNLTGCFLAESVLLENL